MHPTSVDVENEFAEIAEEAGYLETYLSNIEKSPPANLQEKWETALVCASATEKIYTGCERVMARIASEVDQAPVMHADSWHRALLRRMANPFPEVRPAVISPACYDVMDALRAFRHRERSTYGIKLDLEIVLARARQATGGFHMVRSEVRAFFRVLNENTRPSNR